MCVETHEGSNTAMTLSNNTLLGLSGLVAAILIGVSALLAEGPPTPEEYIAKVGGGAEIVPVGQLKLDNWRVYCGNRPTVLNDKLDDYGAAFPGYVILNPRLLALVPTPVKLWIHAHECGHQFRGADEETADCFAVQRGRRQGWLTAEGLEQICQFIGKSKGDDVHVSGTHRCAYMRICYADPAVR